MTAAAAPQSITVAGPGLPKVAHGRGSYVFDATGKRYIDGSGGPAVYCIGHGNEEVNAAIAGQLGRIAHGYRYNFTSDPLEELTEIVLGNCGAPYSQAVFVTGGSEAVESCLKLALQYHHAMGSHTRKRFIARERSWHGNTLGALSVSGFRERREPFEGALIPAIHISPANAYRPTEGAAPGAVAEFCARELEDAIVKAGPETIAAFIFEPVVGAAGGCVPAPPGYAKLVREICGRHGVLLIADEVMCGAGRCGTWRALAHDGVVADIMAVAKGLAGGYLPLGAAVYTEKVAEPIHRVHGGPMTGHTFTGHTACCAAGAAVQKIVAREGLVERVKAKEAPFRALLGEAFRGIEAVGDIRGRGFFLAAELVRDRERKTPFDASLKLYLRIRQRALDLGLICYPAGGNADGLAGDCVILSPPYNASDAELEEIAEKAGRAVRDALRGV